jgi:hypothetical protein
MSRVKTGKDVHFFGYNSKTHSISITSDKECLDFITNI